MADPLELGPPGAPQTETAEREKAPVLIYSLVFPPDGVSTAQLLGELAQDLAGRGHRVLALSTTPHYSHDREAHARQPLRKTFGGLIHRSECAGIPVWHVWHPGGERRMWKRVVGWTLFHVVGFFVGWAVAPTRSVVIVPSPLLTAGLVGAVVARLRRGRLIYNVQELYPDLAVRTGRLTNPISKFLLYRIEHAVYTLASAVTAITPGMIRTIATKGVPKDKLSFVPNFVDTNFLCPQPKCNDFARRHGFHDAFVVSYAGNMGPTQGLEDLLEAADELSDCPSLRVVLVGDGPSQPALKALAATRHLTNVSFVPHQPYGLVPQIYGSSDLCIVPLLEGVEGDALPSKVLRIMACGRPVLAICDPKSDLAALVRDSGGGLIVGRRTRGAVAQAIRTAMENPARLKAMGEAGRQYVAEHFGRAAVTGEYSRLVQAVSSASRR